MVNRILHSLKDAGAASQTRLGEGDPTFDREEGILLPLINGLGFRRARVSVVSIAGGKPKSMGTYMHSWGIFGMYSVYMHAYRSTYMTVYMYRHLLYVLYL